CARDVFGSGLDNW
nr:immunoglobulin heavy chain junction region [Macaca mulatta]